MTPEILREWLKRKEMTQKEFSEMIGVHSLTVSRWINGSRSIPNWLPRFLAYFDKSVKTLTLTEAGDEKRH